MASSSLDLSDRAVLGQLAELLSAVHQAAGNTRVLIVGAAARDLLLVHAHGIEVPRATEDTDLALAVSSWDAFLNLREALIVTGRFTADRPLHRLWFGNQRLDIIPFGGLERADRSITWPTEGAEVMNVSGFTEALATAVAIRLPGGLVVEVASLPAIAVLKIWAWNDRKDTQPGKDASDLWIVLRYYADAGNHDRLYGEEGEALAAFEFELDKAGAWLLGRDARGVLAHGPDAERSLQSLNAILKPEVDPDGGLRLVAQMPPGELERRLSFLAAFYNGLFAASLSKT